MIGKSTRLSKLALAERHLKQVQNAWDNPVAVDWDDLSLYGFYCLEAAVEAAGQHFKLRTIHAQNAEVAFALHRDQGLPDVSELLIDLNNSRKAAAFGDVMAPDLNPADVASEIEEYPSIRSCSLTCAAASLVLSGGVQRAS